MEQLYHVLDVFFAPGILIGLAICFIFLSVPPKAALRNYRVSRYAMAAAYLLYALSIFFEYNVIRDSQGDTLSRPIILFVACFQAFLFTYTLINLISINYLKWKRLFVELAVILVVSVALFSIHLLSSGNVLVWGFGVFVVFYIVLLARYVRLFNSQYSHYKSLMDNFYSDEESRRLQWVKRSFYISLAVGVLALLFALLPTSEFGVVFVVIVIVFYAVFGVRFINYALDFQSIETAITSSGDVTAPTTQAGNELTDRIDELMANEKLYRKSDLSVGDVAALLGERPRIVSAAINTCRHTNFKVYINEFRIAESKRLMDEDKNNSRTIDAIAAESGFTNRSSFYRVFKNSQGISPTDYRLTKKQSQMN